jgi:hypothetical protein
MPEKRRGYPGLWFIIPGVAGYSELETGFDNSPFLSFDKGVQLIVAAKCVYREASVHIARTLGASRDMTKGDLVTPSSSFPSLSGGPLCLPLDKDTHSLSFRQLQRRLDF